MSDYCTKLPVPHALLEYNATIVVTSYAGDMVVTSSSGVGAYINVPKNLPCRPLVTVQAKDLAERDNGPRWCYDYDADQERGVWVIYDSKIHLVPQVSATLPDPEPKESVFLGGHSKVEYDDESGADALESYHPPSDDADDDEPLDDPVD